MAKAYDAVLLPANYVPPVGSTVPKVDANDDPAEHAKQLAAARMTHDRIALTVSRYLQGPSHASDVMGIGVLVRKNIGHGYFWPKGHVLEGTTRFNWEDAPDLPGVKLGTLKTDPLDIPGLEVDRPDTPPEA